MYRTFSTPKIQVLQQHLEGKIPDLLDSLKIHSSKGYRFYVGRCPVHGGDNQSAFNLYHNDNVEGVVNFVCHTNNCHRHFKKTLIGMVRGVLSHQKYFWKKPGDKELTLYETCNWCLDFLNIKYEDLKEENLDASKLAFIKNWARISESDKVNSLGQLTRSDVRKRLIIPASYYLNRGFSQKILDEHDVGFCNIDGKEMSGRIVVPVYDENYHYLTGCIGRSIYEECQDCKCYHSPKTTCPKNNQHLYKKWKNSASFERRNSLYNIWFAKPEIKRTGVAVLVESAGNTWRFKEAGIANVLGMYGTDLAEEQKIMLERLGIFTIVLAMDAGKAGDAAREKLFSDLRNFYRVVNLPILYKDDVAELSVELMRSEYVPIINKLMVKK